MAAAIPNHPAMGVSDGASEELPEGLLTSNDILPAQFFSGRRDEILHHPEQKLWLAVLEDTLRTLQDRGGAAGSSQAAFRRRQRYAEAEAWVRDDSGSDYPGTFVFVCQVLGLDEANIRQMILTGEIGNVKRRAVMPEYRIAPPRKRIRIRLRGAVSHTKGMGVIRVEKPKEPFKKCSQCGGRTRLNICRYCRENQDPRNDPTEAGLPGPEVNSDIYNYHKG